MTRFLLDTHAVLFWWAEPTKLGRAASELLADDAATLFVSAASAWEVATKFRIGKLDFAGDPELNMPRLIEANGFEVLPVGVDHALRAGSLMGDHGDPFDRLIAAQALLHDLTVVTRDPEIARFGCKVLW